jgi:hypothetical protein
MPRFTVIKGAPLAAGWIGKTWALQQLYEASNEEVLVSIDADVRLTNDAINKAVTLLHGARLDFVSPYPRQIANTFAERFDSALASVVVAYNCSIAIRRKFWSEINGCSQWTVLRRAPFGLSFDWWISTSQAFGH